MALALATRWLSRAPNRPALYWAITAAQWLRAVPVPVYADAVAQELIHVLVNADVKLVIAQDQEQVDKIFFDFRQPAYADACAV